MTTNEKIKKIRKERGLTQKQLGELCGIAESTIRRYELGDLNPKLETIKKIADALQVPFTDLLGYEPHEDLLANEMLKIFIQLNSTNKDKAMDYLKLLLKDK